MSLAGRGSSLTMTRVFRIPKRSRSHFKTRVAHGEPPSAMFTHLNVRKHFLRQGGNNSTRFVLLHQLEKWRVDHCHLYRQEMEKKENHFALCCQEYYKNRESWGKRETLTAIRPCNPSLSSGRFLPQLLLLSHLLRVINAVARSCVTVQDSLP